MQYLAKPLFGYLIISEIYELDMVVKLMRKTSSTYPLFWFVEIFVCILIKGMIMPINRTFCKTINWGTTPTPNFISLLWLEGWLRVESNHHQGLVNWKPFESILEMEKESAI